MMRMGSPSAMCQLLPFRQDGDNRRLMQRKAADAFEAARCLVARASEKRTGGLPSRVAWHSALFVGWGQISHSRILADFVADGTHGYPKHAGGGGPIAVATDDRLQHQFSFNFAESRTNQ